MLKGRVVAKAAGPLDCSAVFVVVFANGGFWRCAALMAVPRCWVKATEDWLSVCPSMGVGSVDVLLSGLDATAREDSSVARVAIVSSWRVEFSGALPRWGKGHTPAARTVP